MKRIKIDNLTCICSDLRSLSEIAYILYPMAMPDDLVEMLSRKHAITVVAITGMDWDNVFSPWPARGVPEGSPDFKGESAVFLKNLQENVLPDVEKMLVVATSPERSLIGVSMSGLFTLWQWMLCPTFRNIASLSGSFWYEGFVNWIKSVPIPAKSGKAFFLLGSQESKSNVRIFRSVAVDTKEIISILTKAGIDCRFLSVPGNHYADPAGRLEKTFDALFPVSEAVNPGC